MLFEYHPSLHSVTLYQSSSVAGLGSEATHRSSKFIFFGVVVVGLLWAVITQHVWEDFYITYRASKNLASGNGFTFTVGERVHSYTSPLGALLPAVASLLTGNRSDTLALWIFRLMSIAALATAAVILWRLGREVLRSRFPAALLVVLFATESKIVDFSTNGMETAFVLLFLAWTLYEMFVVQRSKPFRLGAAWAGLMWSRPDSFVYIGALCIGVLVFGRFETFWRERWVLLKRFFTAGIVTTLLYGPWIVWAWWYYGSPIPHTVVAKGLLKPRATPSVLLDWISEYPFKVARTGAGLGTTFMPPYGTGSGWPDWMVETSLYLSITIALLWLVPRVRWEARVASLTFLIGHFYLSSFANFHSPWYVPTLTTLAFVAVAGVFSQFWNWAVRQSMRSTPAKLSPAHWAVMAVILMLPAGGIVTSALAAYQMKLSQSICETGHRRLLGLWLKENARSTNDTVLLEPLGYIGFFSGLKMYDFPGLSSPEVVAVRRTMTEVRGDYPSHFPEIISVLEPDWIVLRESERRDISHFDADLLTKYYTLRREFDVRDKVDAIRFLPGRQYLRFDAYFAVYQRNDTIDADGRWARMHIPYRSLPITVESLLINETWTGPAYASGGNIVAHVPSVLARPVPAGAQHLSGRFGFFDGAYEKPHDSTEGAHFVVNLVDADGTKQQLFSATLQPRDRPEDRGEHPFEVTLVPNETRTLEFLTLPMEGKNNAYGWTYWTNLKFEVPKVPRD
jgi:hypothetical protein